MLRHIFSVNSLILFALSRTGILFAHALQKNVSNRCDTREKRSAHACLPYFRRIFAIEIIRDNKTN